MKRFLTLALAVASVGFIAVGTASAVDSYIAGDAANGIGNSRHNLGNLGEHVRTNSTSEICIFCHTPHHTNTANGLKPLWNRGAVGTYTAYGTTLGGTAIANGDIGSTSLACLSCHDGITTFDNLVNTPGKAGVVAGGSDRGWQFNDVGVVISDFMTSSRLNIGQDLSNDHPVSVVYNELTVAGLRASNTTISAIDLTAEISCTACDIDSFNLFKNLWAVGGYVSDTATIASLLRDGKVECSSCHDPHFNNKSWNEVDASYGGDEAESNGLFLRRVGGNTGSAVCRTCHNK